VNNQSHAGVIHVPMRGRRILKKIEGWLRMPWYSFRISFQSVSFLFIICQRFHFVYHLLAMLICIEIYQSFCLITSSIGRFKASLELGENRMYLLQPRRYVLATDSPERDIPEIGPKDRDDQPCAAARGLTSRFL
jgi:hypothetical protein